MKHIVDPVHHSDRPGPRQWVAAAAFLFLAAYLWIAHQAPWAALLPLALGVACPLMHVRHLRHGRRHRGDAPAR